MEMFLMVAAMSFLGVAVSAALFAAATRDVRGTSVPEPEIDPRLLMAPSQFFVDDRRPAAAAPVSIEALLLQIERHVRLEQAAAEAYHDLPTVEALHMPTTSPLLH
jgi:hypothetical protein